jgi:hypothetical protein
MPALIPMLDNEVQACQSYKVGWEDGPVVIIATHTISQHE